MPSNMVQSIQQRTRKGQTIANSTEMTLRVLVSARKVRPVESIREFQSELWASAVERINEMPLEIHSKASTIQ